MMNHLKAISIKFVYITLITLSLFGIFSEATFTNLLLLSILTTIITYIVGDVLVYPRIGNIITTIFDFGLSFFTLFMIGRMMLEASVVIILTSLGAAFFIMCIEPMFHAYMTERVYRDGEESFLRADTNEGKITQLHPQYITEFAEETHVDKNKQKDPTDET